MSSVFCTVLAAAQRPLGGAALVAGFSRARRSGPMSLPYSTQSVAPYRRSLAFRNDSNRIGPLRQLVMVEIPGMDMLEVNYCNGLLVPFLSPGLHIGEVSCKLKKPINRFGRAKP